jgi:hypothetical protein
MAVSYDSPAIQVANIGGIGNAALTTANTAMDGTGTVVTIFTAGLNGSLVNRIRATPVGTNVASVLRIWINDGAGFTATDNILWRELTLPAITLTQSAAQDPYFLDAGLFLPASYRLTCAIGTTVAAGWYVMVEGGDY